MSEELTDIITQALGEIEDPIEDNLEAAEEATGEVDSDVEDDDSEGDEPTDTESEDDAEETEDDEDSDDDAELEQTYEVKVDGETVEVTLKEALAGYQRQADYTRKLQALSEEKKQLEAAAEQLGGAVEQVQALDQAWEEDPVQVLSHFAANTENPTHAIALMIKELAGQGLLEQQFLEMFGITPDVRQAWAQESELSRLRRESQGRQKADNSRLAAAEEEAAVQRAVAEFDRQIDELLEEEGLDLTVSARKEFRAELARYARDNELTNLKAAFKARQYEESKKKARMAEKTVERAKQKKAASAVTRGGSPAGGSAPVSGDSTDLRSVIAAAMKESQF